VRQEVLVFRIIGSRRGPVGSLVQMEVIYVAVKREDLVYDPQVLVQRVMEDMFVEIC
jgi:hypothetical protein